MATPRKKDRLSQQLPIQPSSRRIHFILPGALSLLILSGLSIAPQSTFQRVRLSVFDQAAQAQTNAKFSAGQQIVIRYEGGYYLATVQKVYQDNGFTMVDFTWELEGGGGGSGTYPADDDGLFTVEEATRQNFAIINAKAGLPPAANTNPPPVAQPAPVTPKPAPVAQPAPAAAGSSSTCTGPNQLTATEIQEILRVHNEARAEVGVAPLKWNCKLADFAQSWVDRDVWEHSSGDARTKILGTYSGENLAGAAPLDAKIATEGPMGWWGEKAFWNNATGKCAPGQVCGHYTQMVWSSTTEVGCGLNRRSSVMGDDWKNNSAFLACVYNPGGNIGGQKPF